MPRGLRESGRRSRAAGHIGTLPPAASRPNPKPEGRNPKEIRIAKPESPAWLACQQPVGGRVVSDFGLRPSFELRPSVFGFQAPQTGGTGELRPVPAVLSCRERANGRMLEP